MKKKIITWLALVSLVIPNFTFANSVLEIDSANLLAKHWIVVFRENPNDYKLKDNVLRQEISAVARWIAKVEKNSICKNIFRDVSDKKPNSWACFTVEALLENNLIAKNENFRPESKITKAEAIWMIVKAGYGNEYKFDSSKEGNWQKQVVDFAVSKWIVKNFSDYNSFATRGFVFSVWWMYLHKKDEKKSSENIETKNEELKKDEKNLKTETKKEENIKKEEVKNNEIKVENKIDKKVEVKKEENKTEVKKEEVKKERKKLTIDEIEKKVKKVVKIDETMYLDTTKIGAPTKQVSNIYEDENISDYILYKTGYTNYLAKDELYKKYLTLEEIEKKVKRIENENIDLKWIFILAKKDSSKKEVSRLQEFEDIWNYILYKTSDGKNFLSKFDKNDIKKEITQPLKVIFPNWYTKEELIKADNKDYSAIERLWKLESEWIELNKWKLNATLWDKSRIVNIKNLSIEDKKELNQFAVDILNMIRDDFWSNTKLIVDEQTINVAYEIAEAYEKDNFNWNGHYNSAINEISRKYGYMVPNDNNTQYIENLITYHRNTNIEISMWELKERIFDEIVWFFMRDKGSKFWHATSLWGIRWFSNPWFWDSKYFGLSFSSVKNWKDRSHYIWLTETLKNWWKNTNQNLNNNTEKNKEPEKNTQVWNENNSENNILSEIIFSSKHKDTGYFFNFSDTKNNREYEIELDEESKNKIIPKLEKYIPWAASGVSDSEFFKTTVEVKIILSNIQKLEGREVFFHDWRKEFQDNFYKANAKIID